MRKFDDSINTGKIIKKMKSFSLFKVIAIFFIALLTSIDAFSQLTGIFANRKDACDGLDNGSIDITVTGSTGIINVQVFGPPGYIFGATEGVTQTVSGMSGAANPKEYLFVITDDNGFVNYFIDIFNITPDLSASLNLAMDNADCATPNGNINIDVSGGTGVYSFAWTGPNGFTSSLEDI